MLTSALTLLSGIVCLYVFGGFMLDSLKKQTVTIFSSMGTYELTPVNIQTLSIKLFGLIILLLAPLFITVILTGILSKVVQDEGRIDFNLSRLAFDVSKMNPINGFGRLFNKDALVEMFKSLLKLALVAWIAYRVLQEEMQNITFLAEADISTIIEFVGHISFKVVTHTCGIMIILGILDMAYVKWRYIENLKMTKQEVKDENREQEGNPEIKGKIRKMQFQMARRRMIKIIPTADVVITNPTHYAIAIKYERERMVAPVVIAKGVDVMAQAIKAIAKEHGVTLVENRFLARELYDQVEENEAIPESLYAAVAEVLAYVYKLKGKI